MELSESQSTVDSVDSMETVNCGSSGGDPVVSGHRQTSTRSSHSREPLEPLIVAALRSAPNNRLLLTDIYRYIETNSTDYRAADTAASQPTSTSAGDEDGRQRRRSRAKDPAWKIHVRHILSVRRDVFPLTTEKDGKRRGRYHALDELQYATRLAAKAQRSAVINAGGLTASLQVSTSSEPVKRRRKRRNRSDTGSKPLEQTHVSSTKLS